MYTPLSQLVRGRSPAQRASTTVFSNLTENLASLPQFLKPNEALLINNYTVTSDGGLAKRAGSQTVFTGTGIAPTLALKFSDTYDIIGYANKVSALNVTTGAETVIHTYTANSTYEGQKAGEYVLVTNKLESYGRIALTLPYDAQTVNFKVGSTVTGGTSGATGIIAQDSDGGATGTLTLKDVNGIFQDNETLTDTSGGSALVNGTLTWTYTTVSAAPVCQTMKLVGSRLFLGVGSTVRYSATDDGTNPPFTNWTDGTNAADPGTLNFENSGNVTRIDSLGNNVVVFAEDGKWAFNTTTVDSNGTLKKIDNTIVDRIDMGGCRTSIATKGGMFYANEGGLWQLIALGQPNIKYSDQENKASLLLGAKYFDDVDLTNADMTYLAKIDTLLITCAKNSTSNNLIIAYNVAQKTFSRLTGWNINRFINNNEVIYGVSSTSNKLLKLFTGSTDDGADIWYEYLQEVQTGGLETRKELLGQYIDAFLSPSSAPIVAFDIYDVNGALKRDKLRFEFTVQGSQGKGAGYGYEGYGDPYGGDVDSGSMVECFDGGRGRIKNFQRLRIHIYGHDKAPHILVWVKLITQEKAAIRRRKLVQI